MYQCLVHSSLNIFKNNKNHVAFNFTAILTIFFIINPTLQDHIRIKLTSTYKSAPQSKITTRRLDFLENHITINNYQNLQYNGIVSLGSKQKDFRCVFDTGSSWLWVPDKSLNNNNFSNRFDCKESDTCTTIGENIILTYGQGGGNAYLIQDQVALGDNLTIDNQMFLLATEIHDFGEYFSDGICGLGFTSLSQGYPTFIDNLQKQQLIKRRMFSFYLNNNLSNDGNPLSELIIDGYDTKYMKNKENGFTYIDVIDDNFWAVSMSGLLIDHISVPIKNNKALIDSGTSLIGIPTDDFNILFNIITEEYGKTCFLDEYQLLNCVCSNVNEFPLLKLMLGNELFVIEAIDYILYYSQTCIFLLQQLDYEKHWILGNVFMRNYYTLFDQDNMKIGFASAVKYHPEDVLNKQLLMIISVLILTCIVLIVCGLLEYFDTKLSNMEKKVPKNQYVPL